MTSLGSGGEGESTEKKQVRQVLPLVKIVDLLAKQLPLPNTCDEQPDSQEGVLNSLLHICENVNISNVHGVVAAKYNTPYFQVTWWSPKVYGPFY